MNKKLSLLFVLPLLCSCHGTSVSCDTVLSNIKNIRNTYDYSIPSYEHYVLTTNRKVGEYTEYSVESYDKDKMFYHMYLLENNVLTIETWKYVQKDGGSVYIYTVERKPNEYGEDKLVEKHVSYDEATWKIEDYLLRESLNYSHSFKLTETEKIIDTYSKNTTNKYLSLSSLNSASYYLSYTQRNSEGSVETDVTIEYKDSLFISTKTISGSDVESSISCEYISFDILYPKIK